MRKNLTEEEFNKWKDGWLREKSCPLFACSQAMFRNECGNSNICGVLYDFEMYKSKKWTKVCDIHLKEDQSKKLPTKICPSCIGSMCLKINNETGDIIGESWCHLMNDFYERSGYKVNRKNEKYIFSMGVFLIPLVGEDAYLEIIKDPQLIQELIGIESREVPK